MPALRCLFVTYRERREDLWFKHLPGLCLCLRVFKGFVKRKRVFGKVGKAGGIASFPVP